MSQPRLILENEDHNVSGNMFQAIGLIIIFAAVVFIANALLYTLKLVPWWSWGISAVIMVGFGAYRAFLALRRANE